MVNKGNEVGTYRVCTVINEEFNDWSMRRCRGARKEKTEKVD